METNCAQKSFMGATDSKRVVVGRDLSCWAICKLCSAMSKSRMRIWLIPDLNLALTLTLTLTQT